MHTNYVNFTNGEDFDNEVEIGVTETAVETMELEDPEETVEIYPSVEEETEETTTDDTKLGMVTCGKLYLRVDPSPESDPVTVLNKGDELMIVDEDDPEWYGVFTASGQEGYCKKEFIEIQ